jgi:hypothetical protein
MQAYILSDTEYENAAYTRLDSVITSFLTAQGLSVQKERVGRDDLAFCRGCFGCWVKTPGRCVIHDDMDRINRISMNSDVVIYLTPIVFGQYSANLKNAVDRWLPNVLPTFFSRSDGSTAHPARYESQPRMIMLGYGAETPEDEQIFREITGRHRRNGEVIIDHGRDDEIVAALGNLSLQRWKGEL